MCFPCWRFVIVGGSPRRLPIKHHPHQSLSTTSLFNGHKNRSIAADQLQAQTVPFLPHFFRASLCDAWQEPVVVQAQFPLQHFPWLLLQQFGALSGQLRPVPHGLPAANAGVGNQIAASAPRLNALPQTQSKSRLPKPWPLPWLRNGTAPPIYSDHSAANIRAV